MADEPKPKTGLDDALSLEATYYATPIPQNMAVLIVLAGCGKSLTRGRFSRCLRV